MLRAILLSLLLLAPSAMAHKLAPSLLWISEQSDGSLQVQWKTPAATAAGRSLRPVFPAGCQQHQAPSQRTEGTAIVWQWAIRCQQGLIGQRLAVEGMAESGTATLVKIQWLDGRRVQQLINAEEAEFIVPQQQTLWQVMGEYLQLGAEHIWSGPDHLLFVLALLLLVPNMRLLIWTITSFTLGHSITLSLVSLGYMDYPVSLVEFAIAASIFVLAVELAQQGGQSGSRDTVRDARWIPRHSWLVAIAFGLLHGMGFAGALKEIGLPDGDIPLALLSFNIGIEIGQLVFVGLVLLLMNQGRRYLPTLVRPGWWATVYCIGSLSVFWCIERGLSVLA